VTKANPLTSRPAQASLVHLSRQHGVKRSITGGLDIYKKKLIFNFFSFFCFKQMRANERVQQSEKDKRNLSFTYIVHLRYNDCCTIMLLFSHFIPIFSYLKINSEVLFQNTRNEVKNCSLVFTNETN
jgi:hypothetical protein